MVSYYLLRIPPVKKPSGEGIRKISENEKAFSSGVNR